MSLFKDFKPISKQEWTDKIINDLKGKDFNDTLTWKSDEGIVIQPIYNKESLNTNLSKNFNTNSSSKDWEIREQITISSTKEANQKALLALKGGATSIQFNGIIQNEQEMHELLNEIMIEIIHIHFYNSKPTLTYQLFEQEVKSRNLEITQLKGSVSYDIYGELLTTGNWATNEKEDLNQLVDLTKQSQLTYTIAINGTTYCNAGATITQEIAYSISQAVEYVNQLTDKGLSPEQVISKLVFNLGISSNYFFEIAKIRAFRILWEMVAKTYGIDNIQASINCQPSTYNIAIQDPHTNILRATTEAMSAIIGGCNSLSIVPFNAAYESSSDFSARVARNIQIILKEEAYLDKVNDIAKGAYYIESITDQLVEKSLELFKDIENKGGYLACITNGSIQQSIKEISQHKEQEYIAKKRTFLGVNKHTNKDETVRNIKADRAITNPVIEPLLPVNLSQKISETIATNA